MSWMDTVTPEFPVPGSPTTVYRWSGLIVKGSPEDGGVMAPAVA